MKSRDEYPERVPEDWPEHGWAWFVHHEFVVEYCTSFQERWEFVRVSKPVNELGRRLAAFRPVLHPERLSVELIRAEAQCREAKKDWYFLYPGETGYPEARNRFLEAAQEYQNILDRTTPVLLALYKEEYPENAHLWNGANIL